MRIQCESNAHRSHPHCVVQNRILACMLTSSGHTSTQLPWCPHQIFTLASHHIASRVEQIHGTQCVAQRSALTVGSRHECACHALFGPYVQRAIAQSSSIRIETTSGSGLGLDQSMGTNGIGTRLDPDWVNAHSVWTRSNQTRYGLMHIG